MFIFAMRRSEFQSEGALLRFGLDLSQTGWGRVVLVTTCGTLLCVIAALTIDSFNFSALDDSQRFRALLVDILLPTSLAAPMLGFLMAKLRELAISKRELTVLATTDSLTAVLNRGAFTMLVESYLDKVAAAQKAQGGALLVVDVDHFKTINDRFGHHEGDRALRLVARAIQNAVRDIDLVGRIGGEEFGVFLPGSSASDATGVAERIRGAITETEVRPETFHAHFISVSGGWTSFTRRATFEQLFREADRHLYSAKRQGRNRVEFAPLVAAA